MGHGILVSDGGLQLQLSKASLSISEPFGGLGISVSSFLLVHTQVFAFGAPSSVTFGGSDEHLTQ